MLRARLRRVRPSKSSSHGATSSCGTSSATRCVLVIFETVVPFRGFEVRAEATLQDCDVSAIRRSIAGRYLGEDAGERLAAERVSKPGVLLELIQEQPRVWSLARMTALSP